MAAVDGLLKVLVGANADALALATDQVPKVSRGGFFSPLSMPAVGAAMMDTFVGEVLAPAQVEEARAAPVSVDYGEFAATVRREPTGWAMVFKKKPPARAGAGAAGAGAVVAPVGPAPPPGWPVAAPVMPASVGPVAPASTPARVVAPAPAAPVVPAGDLGSLPAWIERALAEDASDLIVSAGHGARLRVGGELVELPGDPVSDAALLGLLAPSLTGPHREALERTGSTDVALVWAGDGSGRTRLRVNLFRQAHGLAAAFRPVRRTPPSLADLGLPAQLSRLTGYPNGIVLVVGPTGSGKSTTLVALVEGLNRGSAKHIITLEDPIEYEYSAARSLIHQREVGTHVDAFDSGLRAALREAPDVILVGEMRDRATVSAAMTAAETGHLVLSSLHAGGAAMAVERIIDVFPEHQQRQVRGQLAGALRAILTQHLLPRIGGGLVPAIELALATPAVQALIRDGKTHQIASAVQTGRDDGMVPLDRSLAERVERREVSLDGAVAVTSDGGAQLRELLGRGGARR